MNQTTKQLGWAIVAGVIANATLEWFGVGTLLVVLFVALTITFEQLHNDLQEIKKKTGQ